MNFSLVLMISTLSIGIFSFTQKQDLHADPEVILKKAIEAHGGKKYDTASYQFKFRKKTYTFTNNHGNYKYTASKKEGDQEILDVLENGGFKRFLNGVEEQLEEKKIAGLSGALNSVVYFATLPHKLKDPAVNKKYIGHAKIKGEHYHVLKIYFNEEGGGKDHDDVFHYWINARTYYIDYLAYNYQVNNGGVRFRSAFNPRTIDGIRFQDYVNYKAPLGTNLADLPERFEKSELKELSKIITEEVINLNLNN